MTRGRDEASRDTSERERGEERGEESSNTSLIKSAEREGVVDEGLVDVTGDEVTADDEEDVDARKAAWHELVIEMVKNDCCHRDSAKPIHIRTICSSIRTLGRRYICRQSCCRGRRQIGRAHV